MNRRNFLKTIARAGFTALVAAREQKAQDRVEKAVRGLPRPKIRDISVIETAPAGSRLDVIKITTDQNGLYGYWLRDLYAARRSDQTGCGALFEAAADRPRRR